MIKAKYTFISAGRAEGVKCERCWKIGYFNPYARLCPRCLDQHVEWAERIGLKDRTEAAIKARKSLAGQNLGGIVFYNRDLKGLDFSGAYMPTDCWGSDFSDCNLKGTNFTRSLTNGCVFNHTALEAIMREDQQAVIESNRKEHLK